MVASTNNIAASVNNGFVYFHRDGDSRVIEFDATLFDYDAALYFDDDVRPDDVPILGFQGNEAFAANQGLHVVKANPNQGHDIWSHIDDFTAWSVVTGAHIEYTSHYLLTNFDVVGKEGGFWAANTGIKLGNNVTEVVIRDVQVDGFETGIDLNKVLLHDPDSDLHNYAVIDALISNVENAIANQDLRDTVTTSDELPGLTPDLELDELSYQHSDTYSESVVNISGTKSDSLGMVDFPGGSDSFGIFRSEVVNILETQGYYSTTSGQNYFLVDIYLTDRATGEIFYETHPVFISSDTLSRGPYSGALYNGGQNITYLNGQQYAGDQVLDVPIPASPTSGFTYSLSDYVSTTVDVSLEEEYWLEGYSGTETLSIDVRDGIFVNTGDARNIDLHVDGGEAVLTANNGTLEFGDSRDFQIFGSEAAIGFDGTNGQTAILDFDQGSNLAFVADEDGLGKIQEINSSGLDGTANVLSGIDLGHSTLTIELSGLSSVAGTQFVLMDADEIIGIFEEAVVGGLGARNAVIVVDYEQDVVSLELSEGEGNVTVETVGSEADGDIHVLFYELMRADLDEMNCKTVSHIYSEEVDEEGISGFL